MFPSRPLMFPSMWSKILSADACSMFVYSWMKALNSVLFHTSVFHSKCAGRGYRVPTAFSFAKDLKLCEKQKAPTMEVAYVEDAEREIARLLLYSHMLAEPWCSSEFKIELLAFHTCLVNVAANMNAGSARARSRGSACMDTSVVRSAEAGTSYRAISSTEHVRPCYIELDAALRVLPTGVPLSTECYEPSEFSSRFRWLNDMSVTVACHLINFDVGSAIGILHWILCWILGWRLPSVP